MERRRGNMRKNRNSNISLLSYHESLISSTASSGYVPKQGKRKGRKQDWMIYVAATHCFLSSDMQDKFSKPMPWIGMYIAVASLFCVLAMLADLIHGFRTKKLWFPCKYFTLNAASLTVIAVAMKLPLDLNNPMPGEVDRGAKFGGMAFMCTMMANLLPSLAAMNSKELLTNIIALIVLVITVIVNVCIQVKTGVVSQSYYYVRYRNELIAIVYAAFLLVLLIIHICSALTILKSKQILQFKYQAGHETALVELKLPGILLTVEKLKQHVRNHWIMAGTGNPEFITACSATTSAAGVICVSSMFMHVITFSHMCPSLQVFRSGYNWSMLVILMIQFIGVVIGAIAPLCRCFASLSFKLSIKWIRNHIKVFKVESYWTQKLFDWKQSSIPFSIRSRKRKIVVHHFKNLTLSLCIGFQMTIVVTCKMISLIPIFYVICALNCLHSWKRLKSMFIASDIMSRKETKQPGKYKDLQLYVLQLQDDIEVAERTLKSLSKSLKRLIEKAERQQPKNLTNLLAESRSFEGVEKFDSQYVPSLLSEESIDCWSLPLITLTIIANSLPKIQTNVVDRLLSSVSEGLAYVTLVEESLNTSDEYVRIQKAAKKLWVEVEVYSEWLGKNIKNPSPQGNTAGQILEWFKKTAKNMVTEVEGVDTGGSNENSVFVSICANSMYRVTQTILLSYNTNIEEVSQEELFTELSSMIADIMAACLTNLPQVIAMKCHESAIEKREASVQAAAQLLGETMHVINSLQDRELPNLNPGELPFIGMWRAYLNNPFP